MKHTDETGDSIHYHYNMLHCFCREREKMDADLEHILAVNKAASAPDTGLADIMAVSQISILKVQCMILQELRNQRIREATR